MSINATLNPELNRIVEMHDSKLARITIVGSELHLSFSPAIVHCSKGQPGINAGAVYLQEIDLALTDAVYDLLPTNFPIELSDGRFIADGILWENTIPLPLMSFAAVALMVTTNQGEVFTFRAQGASTIPRGELRYLENFPGSVACGPSE